MNSFKKQQGFTLIEFIMVIVILAIIAKISSQMLAQGATGLITGQNSINANWQGELALEHMARDLQTVRSANSISVASSSALTFVNLAGTSMAYSLSGSNLMLNGDILATGINSLTFTYYDLNGNAGPATANIVYVRIALNVTQNNVNYSVYTSVFLGDFILMINRPIGLAYFKRPTRQQGFLTIVAVMLIMVVGFIGIAITYMIVGSSTSTNNFTQSGNALYAARAGFEEAGRLLLTPNLSGTNSRIALASLTGNTNLTDTTFNTGTFTASTDSGSPYYVNTTLSSALTSSTSTISVASTAGFAPVGRLMIDSEVINYGAISGNSFVGIQRGAGYTYNTPHTASTPVAQYQCDVIVTAGIPNLTSPLQKRTIQQSLQLQEGWAVGTLLSVDYVFTRWNQPTELAWSNASILTLNPASLNSISMLSNSDGWAVGNVVNKVFTILNWTGSAWSLSTAPTACSTQNLLGVSAVYHDEVWTVGVTTKDSGNCNESGGNQRYTVMKWNGSSWTVLTPSTTPSIPADAAGNQNLNAVAVIDATQTGAGTLGFAVGNGGQILQYNGSNWVTVTSPTTHNLLGVYVVSNSEAWAVGAAGTIIKWNGSTWATISSPTTTQLNSIVMLNYGLTSTATSGWAVGDSGVAVYYNGSSWSSKNTGSASNLMGVDMYTTSPDQDVWAVGAAGTMMHYNGSAWSSISSGVIAQLNSISLISPQQLPFAWQEIFS